MTRFPNPREASYIRRQRYQAPAADRVWNELLQAKVPITTKQIGHRGDVSQAYVAKLMLTRRRIPDGFTLASDMTEMPYLYWLEPSR